MLIYLGQLFITTVITQVGISYPVSLYDKTRSVLLLGLVSALSGILSSASSYLWGLILDKVSRRKEFFILLSVLTVLISLLYMFGQSFSAYLLASIASSLDGSAYSLLLLERFSLEELNKQNSRLSQFSLAGNVLGNIFAIFKEEGKLLMLIFSILSIISISIYIPSYSSPVVKGKSPTGTNTNFKLITIPIISFVLFNFASQIFYTLYIPLNYLQNNPSYTVFLSYALLYVVEEFVYVKVPELVKDKEERYAIISSFSRATIMLVLGAIFMLKLHIGILLVPVFITFGTLWTFYNISFFTLLFSYVKKNKGSIIGVFNLSSNLASTIGSLFAGSVASDSFPLAYLSGFYSFILSILLLLSLIRLRLRTS
ncbi:MAG: MFS transporter [Sulfolobaceae archaeon]|nr:MFS transporter [Sulfolobaceae archaeon]